MMCSAFCFYVHFMCVFFQHISLHGDGITHLPPDMYSSFHSDLYPYKSQTAGKLFVIYLGCFCQFWSCM